MKILFLASDIHAIGGIQEQSRKILETLRALGENPILVERKQGFFGKIRFVLIFFAKLFQQCPDFLLTNHVRYAPFCYAAKIFCGAKYAIIFHGIEAKKISFFERLAVKHADKILPVFKWTLGNLLPQFSRDEQELISQKIMFFMNPVNEREFFIKEMNRALIEKHRLAGKKVIMTMARISKEEIKIGNKGYERVLQALPEVLRKAPNTLYLLVGGGDYLAETREKVKSLGLEKYVIMTGAISNEERIDYYNLCDVFILPSKKEGCPAIVLLEAMACGKPVITGNRECQKDDLLEGKLGILIDPEDIGAITDSLVGILTGKYQNLLRGEALRQKAIEKYGLAQYRERMKELITELFPAIKPPAN